MQLDVNHIPDLSFFNQVFYANGSSWQVWNKPNRVKSIYIFVLGGAGGGGGGRTGGINTATGGGGGGSSSITIGKFNASMIPDVLYLNIGMGGAGGSAGSAGSNGNLSYVCMQPNLTSFNILLQSGDAVATAGGGGGTSIQGTAGVGGTAWTYTNGIFNGLGLINSVAGSNGAQGGTQSSAGGSITPSLPVSGGAGGGGTSSNVSSFNGGNITGSGFLNTLAGGTANFTTGGQLGRAGYNFINNIMTPTNVPLFFTGGSGGAGAHSVNAGSGGNGGRGSGGGGGGGSYQNTGGSGGSGGNGMIFFVCV